ncbi:MAG TPA: hypothetical protein VIJ37_08870 [Steroidobacteraceae bacterium]
MLNVKYCLLILALVAAPAFARGAGAPGVAGTSGIAGMPSGSGVNGRAGPRSRAAADRFRAWKAAAVQALIARGDPDSLATAAGLSFPGSSALSLAARAGELAPQNAAIGWLRLQLCVDTPGCDIRDVATVMRWVDADNGAVWLPTLAVAQREKDATEIDRVLADMAHGSRFDLYWSRIVVLMFDALSGVHKDLPGGYLASDSSRLAALYGVVGAEVIPPFGPLLETCRGPAGTLRRDVCMKLSKTMQRGDTVIAQMVGFSIERRLLAPDSRESRAIAERKRLLEWRMAAAAQFDTPLLPWLKNARARARLKQMRANPREEDVGIAILREHRMPIQP